MLKFLRKSLVIFLSTGILFLGLHFILYTSSDVFSDKQQLSPPLAKELTSLAVQALQSDDVPISAILLYGRKIIGRGYNTVLRDTNAGGHAEINAISDAIKKYGRKEFSLLDRDSLKLITTYEPCIMCRGAILEYNIRNVQYLKAKTTWHWMKEDLRTDRFLWNRLNIEPERLQDSLFELHPGYKKDN